MSFWKAEQLLALATLVAARHSGLTLDDVIERFDVSKRTAQRMLRALEAQFSDADVTVDDEGRKRWRLPSGVLRDLMSLYPEELVRLILPLKPSSAPASPYGFAGQLKYSERGATRQQRRDGA
jgi:predicted DNA-binding transcriptional regulator YafY